MKTVGIRRFASGMALVAAASLVLGGCSDGTPPGDGSQGASPSASSGNTGGLSSASPNTSSPASNSASAPPTPVPASSKGPAKNWPVPKMPAEAKKKTPEGAAAFTEYYFELIEYTTVTNDSAPIKGITTHGCGPCGKIVIDPADRNREIKAWNAGGAIDFTPVQARIDGAESALVTFKFDQEKLSIFNPGGVLAAEVPATKMPESGSIGLIYEKGWKTDSLSFVEDE